jgi:hypothetical protein
MDGPVEQKRAVRLNFLPEVSLPEYYCQNRVASRFKRVSRISSSVIDLSLGCNCQICIQTALKSRVSRDFGRNPCHLSEMNESRSINFETQVSNAVLKLIQPDFRKS